MTNPTPFPRWPPDWPEIAQSIARAVQKGDWGRYRGAAIEELVARITDLHSIKHCRLVCSGSIGIQWALQAVGVTAGDQVALCGYDYPGNFRAIEALGARPVLVDVDPTTYSIDPQPLRTIDPDSISAVVVSHLYGIAAQIESIRRICDEKGWKLVEDACQNPAMPIAGRPAGTWGDIGVVSFGGSKPLTAGNGGALLTNNDAIASKLNAWLDRPSDATPLSELQAAAVLPQIDRLDACNQVRWESAQAILSDVGWMAQAMGDRLPCAGATFYKFAFLSPQRESTLEWMTQAGLPVGKGYRSMHRSSDRRCGKIGDLRGCRDLGDQLCLLDHSVLLSEGSQRQRLIDALNNRR
ncbi:MAG: DegT/DnrJ/EryC1/StrS aminotransferase family protein [Planctomycetales bacterium]|nr:DegT/DnrJ/EryC1/StrS aminotransferase family protein [Planctomycetales bacterium]